MAANAFLVRYSDGWAERTSTSSISSNGRFEALLGLGAITSLAEVNRVADGQLDDFAEPREQTDIKIDPRWANETPYLGFGVGDTVTVDSVSHRVLGLTITEDPNTDRVEYVPTLNENVVLSGPERVAQALTKMVRGTVGGRSKVAQPVVPAEKQRGLTNSGASDSLWSVSLGSLFPTTPPDDWSVTGSDGSDVDLDGLNGDWNVLVNRDINETAGRDVNLGADNDININASSGESTLALSGTGDVTLFGNNIVVVHGTTDTVIGTSTPFYNNSDLVVNSLLFFVDEGTNQLKVAVKYSGGTVKTGTICTVS